LGNFSVKVVRSIFALPTTAMRGRFAIGSTELFLNLLRFESQVEERRV
jgi:hypothetical protein